MATLFAVLTGFTIASYIIADGFGVRAAGPDMAHRLSYIAWLCVLEGPWLLVLAIVLRPNTVWAHLKSHWWKGLIGGVIVGLLWSGSVGVIGSIVVAFIGACILIWLLRLVSGNRVAARV